MIRHNDFAGIAAASVVAAWMCGCGGGDIDRRVPAVPGGELTVDIELGSGISFDRGSLEISTHTRSEVQVITDVTGWGDYAVDVDISEHNGNVRVVGRVDGALHWMFGGPTVDVRIITPNDFRVDARIDGGDMLLEDLVGPVTASVADADLALLRSDGDVRLASGGGNIRVEDVAGTLQVDSGAGNVMASGIHGGVNLRTDRGNVGLSSVTGPVAITSDRGAIELKRIRGDVRVESRRGPIAMEDVVGDLNVSTDRSRIQVEELRGSIHARSKRGSVEVAFAGPPAGAIDTTRGSIHVEVPVFGGFSVEADTQHGEIEIAEGIAFVPRDDGADVAAGPSAAEQIRELRDVGRKVAAEVRTRVAEQMEQVRREWDRRRRNGQHGWSPQQEWEEFEGWNPSNRPWPWENPDWQWPSGPWPGGDWTNPSGDDVRGNTHSHPGRGDQLSGDINGGGKTLRLHSDRGSIRIDQR